MLEEDLIKRDDYKDIAEQLVTWDDSKYKNYGNQG